MERRAAISHSFMYNIIASILDVYGGTMRCWRVWVDLPLLSDVRRRHLHDPSGHRKPDTVATSIDTRRPMAFSRVHIQISMFRVHRASEEVPKQLDLEKPPEITAIAVNGGIGIGGRKRDACLLLTYREFRGHGCA
jgi:hypothetical protein